MSALSPHASPALREASALFTGFVKDFATFPTFLTRVQHLSLLDSNVEKLLPFVQQLQPPENGGADEPPGRKEERRFAFQQLSEIFSRLSADHPTYREVEGGVASGGHRQVQVAHPDLAAAQGSGGGDDASDEFLVRSQPEGGQSLSGALKSPFGDGLLEGTSFSNMQFISEEVKTIMQTR